MLDLLLGNYKNRHYVRLEDNFNFLCLVFSSKGINRVVGTFTAGTLAVAINHIGPLLGAFHPFFVVLCCFGFTVILTFFKYKAPFKER